MYYPDEAKFKQLARKGNLIPVYKEGLADLETPVSAFMKLGQGRFSYLLESVEMEEGLGRYSFLGVDPFLVFEFKGKEAILSSTESREVLSAHNGPLGVLKKVMARFKVPSLRGLPRFFGGAVGYVGYDVTRFWENVPAKNPDDLSLPDALFMFANVLLIFDHRDHRIRVVSYAFLDGKQPPKKMYEQATKRIDEVMAKLRKPTPRLISKERDPKGRRTVKVTSNLSRSSYEGIVRKAKEYIRDGDIFQVVLSQRVTREILTSSFNIYRALRSLNPSPYMYYLRCGDFEIVGSSPEILVRVEGGDVTLRPIAGTRRRGRNQSDDKTLAKELLADPKERSEHIMLVDLGRNDVGRVCQYGTVKVSELMVIERYSHVMHLVSNVQGRLKRNLDQYALLKACFPAGTVSGAPKVRAMEVIDELEPTARGPYAGALGYFSFSGNMDTCIIIRTIIVKDGFAHIQAGAGIVADSNPRKEYQETMNKARALTRAIEMAEEGLE